MSENDNTRDATVTVGTTSVLVADERRPKQRQALILTNTSTAGQIISVNWGGSAVVGRGIVLYPGGTYSESVDNAYTPSFRMIQAIASAASGTLAVHEQTVG